MWDILSEMLSAKLSEIEKTTVDFLVLVANLHKIRSSAESEDVLPEQREAMSDFLGPEWNNHPKGWFLLTAKMTTAKNYIPALIACDEALKLMPNFSLGWSLRGSILYEGFLDVAKSVVDEGFNVGEEARFKAEAYLGRKIEDKIDKFEFAEKTHQEILHLSDEAHRKAIAIDPNDAALWFGLGQTLSLTLNKSSETANAYLKAVELNPQNISYWITLYDWYQRLKRKNDMKKLEKQAKKFKLDLRKEYQKLMKGAK